jgi:ribulose-bisphosphate carboxylase large chain
MRYIDYVDLDYKPKSSDLVCDFYAEPVPSLSVREAAGAVAAESSTGTWTELTTEQKYVLKLGARVFSIHGNNIRIAYPVELFEAGNMPNILSSVAGNVFGMRDLKNLRLNHIHFPEKITDAYKGPKFGIAGIRKLLRVPKRPLVGTIVKPKLGLCTADHAQVAYEAWAGGCDIVKDDENLSSQKFNGFEKRIIQTLKARDRAERETGERKVYMANVTAETSEMIRRAKFVKQNGGEYAMVDIITCGWSAMQTLRAANEDLKLVLHAHRAMHAALTKNPKHGISMRVISEITRLVGLDQLHIGTAVGKMFETREEVMENRDELVKPHGKIKPVFPVASGGLHPGMIPQLFKTFGKDVVMQFGGGIHGNPLGTRSGAMAARQSLDAVLSGISLKEYSRSHKELATAIEKWGEK